MRERAVFIIQCWQVLDCCHQLTVVLSWPVSCMPTSAWEHRLAMCLPGSTRVRYAVQIFTY